MTHGLHCEGVKCAIWLKDPRPHPRIRARITDLETDLAKADITLRLDGESEGSFSYDSSKDKLTYKSGRLEEGRHTVKIKATDGQLKSSERWSFRVKD